MTTTLNRWLLHLEKAHPVAIDLGLERIRAVADRLRLFDRRLARRIITVAGTNGKGSTAAMLEAQGLAHGLTTALYTSPHLVRYNERLRLDGIEASDDALMGAFARIESARADTSLTYFEVGTLAALLLIAERAPDLAILEVGLGGRLDATNIIDADVSIITSVAQDHAGFLGTDLLQIGREKAGIMRPSKPTVLGSRAMVESVAEHAAAIGVSVCAVQGRDFDWQIEKTGRWQWSSESPALQLTGLYDPGFPLDNAAAALKALSLTGITLEPQAVAQGFERVTLAGRMQRLGRFCLDVAHNPHAAAWVASRLGMRPVSRRIALLGMLADKDAAGVIEALSDVVDDWLPVGLEGERARSAESLAALIKERGGRLLPVGVDTHSALEWLETHRPLDEVLVCGSFYTVAETLSYLEGGSRAEASSEHRDVT